MANVIHSTLTYNANLGPAQAQIKALTGQIATLTAAFNTLDKAALKTQAALSSTFLANAGGVGGFTTQVVKASSSIDNFGQALSKQRLTMRQYFREAIAGYTKQNSLMKQLAMQQVRMQQSMAVPIGGGQAALMTPTAVSMTNMANKTALAAQKFSIFNELVQGGSTRLLNFGKNTQWTGRQLMVGFTLPLILFTAVISKQFREIDKELTRFEKVYGSDLVDTVDGSSKRMREAVKELAFEISGAYGIAAKDTAALAADIAATGKEGQALLDSVKQTTRLSVLGEVERQEAMQATLSIQNAFKLNTLELAESIDFLNAVENQTSTTLQDLAGAIPRVGPVIQSLGGDIKDLSVLLVAMREGGVSAAEAANALKSGLGRMINPTRQAKEVASSFGVSLDSIVQNSRGELLPMIFGLQDALSGLDEFARAQVIEKIFGKYQFARMSALFANLRRQGSQTLTVMELASASSTQLASIANQELRALQESTSMRFQRTIENLKNSLIPLGQTLTETLIPILSGIGSGIKGFMEFFQSLPQPIKDFTKFAVAITALAGPVVMLVGLFGNLIANGVKFGMMLVRLSAKMVGMRFEKFELLTKDVMEARLSVDMLTDGFEAQEVALRRLTGVIQGYASALRTSIPAAGSIVAPMAPRPGSMPLPVYRRQKGSTGPEFVPGSGRGDKIPAMLEPGEFVVNRKATEKFGPILVAMNRGNVQGFEDGMDEKYVKAHLAPSLQVPAGTLLAQPGLAPGTRDILSQVPATQLITAFNNLVVALKHTTNSALNTGNAMASTVAAELKTSQAWSLIMNQTGLDMKQLQPVIDSVTGRLANLGNEMIDDPQLYDIVEQSLRELGMAGDKAAGILQTLSRQYGAYAVPGTKQQRQDLGVGIAPSYRGSGDPRVGPKVQSMPFVDLRAGGVGVSPASGMSSGARFGGLESITNAQKIASAEKAILDYTKRQELFAHKRGIALRDMAEITAQIKQLEEKQRKGQITYVEFERRRQTLLAERQRLSEDVKKSETMEKKYQDRITSATGRIASIEERRAAVIASTNRRLDAVSAMAAKGARSDINARPGTTGPSAALIAAKDSGTRGGGGLMNAAFMGSMAISSVAMLGGASSEAAMKIGMFSTALMMATMMLQSVSAKGMFTNFLGMGALGGKISGAAGSKAAQAAVSGTGPAVASSLATRQTGVVAKHAAGGLAPLGGGLATLGRGVSVLGGPVGMAAAAAITAGIAGYMAYRNAAEEARERAVAAFADPAKTAEYFGISVEDVTEKLKGVSAALPGIEEIDQALRDSVKQDYAGLIEKIRFSGAQGGARELAVVFNKMLASGLSAEQAEEAVKAIAMESGAAGGAAYAEGMRQGFFAEKDAAQVAQSMADLYNPEGQQKNIAAAQQALTTLENRVGEMGRMGGTLAQNLDNTFGDFLTGYASYGANIGNSILSGFTGVDLRDVVSGPFDMIFDKDKAQGTIDLLANTERQIHQMQTNIEEMADVTGDSVVKITEVMFQNFQKAPEETIKAFRDIAAAGKRSTAVAFDTQPIKDFIAEIDPISGTILNAMIGEDEDMAMMVQEAIISGMSVSEIIETITRALESGGDIKAELQAEVDLQIKETNINNEITRLRDELKEDLVMDLDLQIEDEEKQLEKVNKQLERMDDFRARHEGVLKKEMNRLNRQSEDAIEGMENEIETIRDRAETRKEDFDERMDQLNKEKEEIEDSAESYIDSLKKRERADNFYSNQRKTAFSALQKLAAGDVFGFLQEREQMSADAQTFSYENTIDSIEEKRDREIETIDEVMEKEKERQKDYEKKVEDRIELIEDQIDAEKDLMDERQKNFDKEMRFFDRREKRRRTDLENEKKEVQVSLDQLRATREMAESGTLVDQKELSKALGEEKAKPYFEEQKAIVKTEMMKKYLEMKDKYPDETSAQLQMRAHGELIDLFNALYGVTPGQGRRPTMGWAQQLEDIGFTPEFNEGGRVKGPGTGTSDSIPARLSNGEYVIRASSVKKYGTSLMDSINTAKFANGGYVSADRAETAANNNVYAGGWKPKPSYSGGTPTSSTGYSTANTQASSNIYGKGKKKNSRGTPMRPVFGTPIANAQDATRTGGYQNPLSPLGSFLSSLGIGVRDQGAALLSRFTSPFSFTGSSYGLYNANPNAGYVAPSVMTGQTQKEYSNYVDAGQRDMDALLFASNFLPIPSFGLGAKAASLLGRSAARVQKRTGMNPGPAQYTQRQGLFTQLIEQKYGDQIVGNLIRASDDPAISGLPAGMKLESHLGPSTGALNAFVHKYALTQAAKNKAAIIGADVGDKPIKTMSAGTVRKNIDIAINAINKSDSNAGLLTSMYDTSPYRVIQSLSASDPEFAALSLAEKREITSFLASSNFDTKNAKSLSTSGGFDNPTWNDGQVNMIYPDTGRFGLLNTIAHEMGHTTDFMFNRSKYGYGFKGIPENANPLTKWYLSKVNSIKRANQAGKTEAYAESNRLRAIKALMEDAGVDPSLITRFTREGGGVGPYQSGIKPGSYANSPLFKISYAMQMRRNMKGQDALFDTRGFSMRKSGIFSDMITSTPEWLLKMLMQKAGRVSGYADGGLVQGFHTGGPVGSPKFNTRSFSVRSGWQGNRGPNGWPYNPSLAYGVIPGTSRTIQMQKDVLPLFLSFASDYNRLIRKIGPNTGAYDPRNAPEGETKSNHPSGTALDINTNEEGNYFQWISEEQRKANFDWWKGKKSALAPWDSIAPMPYIRMKQLLSKYKILQWFGPKELGGPSWLSWDSIDPMHIQLNQDTDPKLNDVQRVMKELGIEADGTGAPGVGEQPGEGNKKPRDPRPRSGANGGGLTGVPSEGSQGNTQFGKVAAKYLARAILPDAKGKNKPNKDGNKPDKDGNKPDKDGNKPSGSYKDQYIKNGLLVKLLHETGFKGGDLRTAFGVVMGESGGNRRAVNNNGTSKDWGLFQMNDYWNRNIVVDGKKADFSPEKIFDAQYNSRLALATTKDPGVISYWKDPWKDWNAYSNNTRWYQNGLKLFDANPQWRKAIGLANGGSVFGPGSATSDSIPAMLSNGEYVINADSVRKYGRGFLDKVNSGQLGNSSVMPSGFANGGFASPSYNVPVNNNVSSSQLMNSVNNMSVQGSNATSNNSNIKIVVNGSNTSAKAVANQVVRMINNATSRRDHSRSIS